MREKLYPSEQAERFIVRFPEGMRDEIKELAEKNRRSMNAEIVAWLEKGLEQQNQQKPLLFSMENIGPSRVRESPDYNADIEKQLINKIKTLPSEHQRALLIILGL